MAERTTKRKSIETITHDGTKRRNIPTAEYQAAMRSDDQNPIQVAYERCNSDLNPQLVWCGKDMADWSVLVVQAPPRFTQEKVHPTVLIDDLARMSRKARAKKHATEPGFQTDFFGDFNGLPDGDAKTELYWHDANWSNRMIWGESLQVMASLAEGEGLRRKVQCIYMDPPYGIKFNSSFSWSTTSRAEYETLYDKPYEDKAKTRVAGPFTVESLSPHRLAALDEDDKLMVAEPRAAFDVGAGTPVQDSAHMVLENLRTAGVQQADKRGHIKFTSLDPWPGNLVCADGRYAEGGGTRNAKEQRAGIFIGPEFGTVSRTDLVRAEREAADGGFDALIACAFNYEAHATEFNQLGRVPVLKARMNADLHMADDLKKTDKANLFVIFGEPDIDIEPASGPNDEPDWLQVKINGMDVFDPSTGQVRSNNADGIACWFVDTDYNEESFFVRQAYFLGAGDPYKSLKTTLIAEIDPDAWATLNSETSRAFPKPSTGRIAVKVINHLGDEVMKVFGV